MNTTVQRDERVMTIVAMALRQPADQRDAYLRLVCGNDPELYCELAETVEWEQRMGSFLLHPMFAFKEFAPPFDPGQVISGRFEIIREIGEGGMGVVYQAFDRKRNQAIAIKAAKPGFHRLLSPELEGALKVRHPNICLVNEIHTAQTDHGEIDFLTMELLEGETLYALLSARGKLSQSEALDIARQLCAGVAEAHRSGVIHRDLKSGNVILSSTATGGLRAVITDFGLAGGMAQSGEIAGTPRYMAPELWSGEKASVASDIYSLGVVLYEMVAGRPPYDDDKSVAERLTSSPPVPSTWAEGLDPRWDRTLLRCLHSSPAERWPDATQVLAGLEKKPASRVPLAAAAAVVFVLAAMTALVPSLRQKVMDWVWPPPNIRLAVLPCQGPNDTMAICGGALQDVSDRIRHFHSGNRSVVVIPPAQVLSGNVQTPEQAGRVLHATHALQTRLLPQGDTFVAEGSVIDVSTGIHLRDFSGRYSPATTGSIPAALAGAVSMALRLRGDGGEQALSPAATAPYDKALYLLRSDSQKFDEAISHLREAARLDPRSPLPLAGLVEAEIKKFDASRDRRWLEEAQRFLSAAESLNPDSVRVLLAAGLLKETSSQYERALEDYRRVQDLEPRNTDAFLRSAKIYDRLDMPDKAIEAFRQARDVDPAYYLPYRALGVFYYHRGRYLEAAEQFQETVARAPGMFLAHSNLGASLMDLGRYAEAEQALLASLRLHETADALNNLGAVRAYQKRDAEAARYYERAVALQPREFLYLENLADSYRRLGRFPEARRAYRKAMDLALVELNENPRLGYSRGFVGYIAARLGDRKRAEDEISQALHLSPGDKTVIRNAVLTYEALGQRDRAVAILSGATAEVLRELDRQPDLADFRQDSRFQQLVSQTLSGGK